MAAGTQSTPPAQTAQGANLQARQYLIQNAIEETQQIYSATLTGTIPGQVVNIPVRNVGLIKRFLVQISYNYVQSASETQTLTSPSLGMGTSNILSQVVLTDLNNQTRINTSGWHLDAVATQKRNFPYGASIGTNAAAGTDCPFGYGTNFQNVQTAPATVTGTSKTIYKVYEVPVAYSDLDLRGSIYANIVNATMNLQLTVNPNINIGSGGDPVLAVYQSSTAGDLGTISSFTVTVYQVFMDQIPMGKNGPVLPILDLSTAYMLQNTSITNLVNAQDNPVPYANYRDFLGTTLIYDHNKTLTQGTDINYFSLQAANYTNIWKYTPTIAELKARLNLGIGMPLGTYWFDHRAKPISTVQYGNLALNINPSTSASCTGYIGYEMMALINQVTQAGSLYGQ